VIRYAELELGSDAIGRLLVALEEIGEDRLAARIARDVGVNGAELLLRPGDDATILRALAKKHIPELAGLTSVLRKESEGAGQTLPTGERKRLRETRLAANEAFFRSLNERMDDRAPDTRPLIVVCECADEDCAERLEVTRSDYEKARSDPRQFIVAHQHADPEIEEVVLRTDRFEMVRKIGVGARIAARLDP
jgi:hypothetical protein